MRHNHPQERNPTPSPSYPLSLIHIFQAEGVNRHGIEGEKQGEDYRNRDHAGGVQTDVTTDCQGDDDRQGDCRCNRDGQSNPFSAKTFTRTFAMKALSLIHIFWFSQLGSHVFSDARERMDVLHLGMGTPPREPAIV